MEFGFGILKGCSVYHMSLSGSITLYCGENGSEIGFLTGLKDGGGKCGYNYINRDRALPGQLQGFIIVLYSEHITFLCVINYLSVGGNVLVNDKFFLHI